MYSSFPPFPSQNPGVTDNLVNGMQPLFSFFFVLAASDKDIDRSVVYHVLVEPDDIQTKSANLIIDGQIFGMLSAPKPVTNKVLTVCKCLLKTSRLSD